jgi:hypothetical protein
MLAHLCWLGAGLLRLGCGCGSCSRLGHHLLNVGVLILLEGLDHRLGCVLCSVGQVRATGVGVLLLQVVGGGDGGLCGLGCGSVCLLLRPALLDDILSGSLCGL